MVNEDANAKLIRELKEEIQKLRELLKAEGIEVQEGLSFSVILFFVDFRNHPKMKRGKLFLFIFF